MALLNNVSVLWTSIQAPDTKFDHVWRTDAVITQEQADTLQAEAKKVNPKGIKFRKGDNDEIIFRVTRKVNRADGGTNDAPKCVSTERGSDGKPLPFTELVGNGSICNIQYSFYNWENSFGNGCGVDFKGLQVVDLVSYGAPDGDEFEATGDTPTPPSEDYDDDDFM